jgi:hypothetical protein
MALRVTRIEDTATSFNVEYMDEGKGVYRESFAPRPPRKDPTVYANEMIANLPGSTQQPPAPPAQPEPVEPLPVEHEGIALGEPPAPDDPNQPQPPIDEESESSDEQPRSANGRFISREDSEGEPQ